MASAIDMLADALVMNTTLENLRLFRAVTDVNAAPLIQALFFYNTTLTGFEIEYTENCSEAEKIFALVKGFIWRNRIYQHARQEKLALLSQSNISYFQKMNNKVSMLLDKMLQDTLEIHSLSDYWGAASHLPSTPVHLHCGKLHRDALTIFDDAHCDWSKDDETVYRHSLVRLFHSMNTMNYLVKLSVLGRRDFDAETWIPLFTQLKTNKCLKSLQIFYESKTTKMNNGHSMYDVDDVCLDEIYGDPFKIRNATIYNDLFLLQHEETDCLLDILQDSLSHNSTLTALTLRNFGIKAEHYVHIIKLVQNSHLHLLDIRQNAVGTHSDYMKIIQAIKVNQHLMVLKLDWEQAGLSIRHTNLILGQLKKTLSFLKSNQFFYQISSLIPH